MAKKIKSTITEDEETISANGGDESEDHEIETPKLDKTQASALLATYIEANNSVTKIEEQLDTAKQARAEAAKQIYNSLGKGPFQYRDMYLGKVVFAKGTYFFRGRGDSELVSFD